MQFNSIPEELRLLRQWIVWHYEDIGAAKPTKVPYSPCHEWKHANVNEADTWGSFEEAVNRFKLGGFDGIGFVFTDADPYTFIDLDACDKLANGQPNPSYQMDMERQVKIFREFDSYSEVSPSNHGLHVIVKGKVPVGRRRSFIEVYSSQRYATFTGQVYNNKPIAYRQDILSLLWEQMGSTPTTHTFNGAEKEILTDEQVISQALNAVNGDKFKTLLEGKWSDIYPSQSEGDFAFIDIIAFYTQNKKQIERIFKASPLGARQKALRTGYIDRMIMRSFDHMLPPIDFDGFKTVLDARLLEKQTAPQMQLPMELPEVNHGIAIPDGLMGEIAQFIYQAAPRPVPEIALAASIGLLAGICGRAYNVSNTGLNQYVLLIANTGTGKEAMASGIDKLINVIRMQVPTASEFIGPAEIASGQALVKYLNRNPCFVSILGEFGLRLHQMSSNTASSVEVGLRRILLDLYNKSGHGQTFRGSIYSDKDKNIEATQAPAFSILGESTPERFYGVLNEDMISEGLLPRFTIIEYTGPVINLNKGNLNIQPSFSLIEKLAALTANCAMIMHAKKVIDVQLSPEAEAMSDQFERHCTDQLNRTTTEVRRQLWNRAHIKALKIAALIAVGVNMVAPLIIPKYLEWAIKMVQSDITSLSAKFDSGEVGSNSHENKQIEQTYKAIRDYFSLGDKYKSYGVPETMYAARVIPYAYLNRKLLAATSFRNDKIGATNALKRVLQTLVDSDKIREIGKGEMAHRFGSSQRAFMVSDLSILG